MFIGHFAVGFAAKRAAPKTNLAWLLAAPQLADLLWPVFVLLGWERFHIEPGNTVFTPLAFDSYPWSHSLLMLCLWATAMACIYYALQRYVPGAVAIWLAVVSHWVLDVATHRPDMPLWPGGPLLGMGLWNHKAATLVVESAMFLGALWIYAKATRPLDRLGSMVFWVFVGFLVVAYLGNAFGPPPPSEAAVTWTTLAMWVLIPWIAWFDRHRELQ